MLGERLGYGFARPDTPDLLAKAKGDASLNRRALLDLARLAVENKEIGIDDFGDASLRQV